MKKIALVTFLLSGVVFSYAQGSLAVGRAQLNTGFGFSNWGVPVYVGLDYGAAKDFTLGGELSLRSYNNNFNGTGYNHNIIGVFGNGNYHFNSLLNLTEKIDFYAGLNLGFYTWTSPSNYPENNVSGLGVGAQVGARYYFSRRVGLNLEINAGNEFSGGKFGVTFKL